MKTKGYIRTLLGGASGEFETTEIELSAEDLRPIPLVGASIEKAIEATEIKVASLSDRRLTIRAEIDRLSGELANTEAVLRAHEAALAVLAPKKAEALAPKMPAATQLEDAA
jgi:hypothetical protein